MSNEIYTYILELTDKMEIMSDENGMNYMHTGEYELLKIIQIPEAKKILFLYRKLGKEPV